MERKFSSTDLSPMQGKRTDRGKGNLPDIFYAAFCES